MSISQQSIVALMVSQHQHSILSLTVAVRLNHRICLDAIYLYFGIGGRTAWSATVTIQGMNVAARYWFDGQFINNAKARAFFIYFGSTSNELSRRTPQKSQ
jgi:hypothetical protein